MKEPREMMTKQEIAHCLHYTVSGFNKFCRKCEPAFPEPIPPQSNNSRRLWSYEDCAAKRCHGRAFPFGSVCRGSRAQRVRICLV